MQLFRYETHAHTSEVSKCAKITGAELAQFYKNQNFDGLCITDHFLNGNTTVPRDLVWEERIELFCKGYENAYAEGEKIGIKVFFGWEYSYRGTDFLTYGLNKAWLLTHPEVVKISVNEYCDLVHRHGGFVVHAHPFREADYIDMIRLLPRKVDGVEVLNGCRLDFENQCADEYADKYGLLKLGGTDNHVGWRDRLCGMGLARPLESVEELICAVKANETELLEMVLEKNEMPYGEK